MCSPLVFIGVLKHWVGQHRHVHGGSVVHAGQQTGGTNEHCEPGNRWLDVITHQIQPPLASRLCGLQREEHVMTDRTMTCTLNDHVPVSMCTDSIAILHVVLTQLCSLSLKDSMCDTTIGTLTLLDHSFHITYLLDMTHFTCH